MSKLTNLPALPEGYYWKVSVPGSVVKMYYTGVRPLSLSSGEDLGVFQIIRHMESDTEEVIWTKNFRRMHFKDWDEAAVAITTKHRLGGFGGERKIF